MYEYGSRYATNSIREAKPPPLLKSCVRPCGALGFMTLSSPCMQKLHSLTHWTALVCPAQKQLET